MKFGGAELWPRAMSVRTLDVSRISNVVVAREVNMIVGLLVSGCELNRLAPCAGRELANQVVR